MNPFSLLTRWRGGHGRSTGMPPEAAFRHYATCARRLGIDRLYLFLSFDCDTDWDVEAVEEVHAFLAQRGIKATYAVPGAQLERGAAVYRRLAASGAEFMNHGGRPHAEWQEDHWAGITFYNTMRDDEVAADMRRGHDLVVAVTGQVPRGFRAPHFGCFNESAQVDLLHRTAAALGYRYCSTTIPRYGLERGPAYLSHGVVELPCLGSFRNPETILDSWTYLTDRKKYALGDDYYTLFAETLTGFTQLQLPVVLTWYADPCHVHNQAPFAKAMDLIARLGIPSLTGSELADMVYPRLVQSGAK